MFFVEKNDSKKRMVQDYRYFNGWTIKNNYPLPLISDIVENICYELRSLGLNNRTTLVLSNTKELDRDSFTK